MNWFVAKVKICIPEDNTGSSPPEVFLSKGILKIYSKFTGEHPCQSVISIKLQNKKPHFGMGVLLKICCIFSDTTPFIKNTSEWLLLLFTSRNCSFSEVNRNLQDHRPRTNVRKLERLVYIPTYFLVSSLFVGSFSWDMS